MLIDYQIAMTPHVSLIHKSWTFDVTADGQSVMTFCTGGQCSIATAQELLRQQLSGDAFSAKHYVVRLHGTKVLKVAVALGSSPSHLASVFAAAAGMCTANGWRSVELLRLTDMEALFTYEGAS